MSTRDGRPVKVRHPVGTRAPMKRAGRITQAAEEMEKPLIEVKAVGHWVRAWLAASLHRGVKAWRRWIDYTLPLTLLLLAWINYRTHHPWFAAAGLIVALVATWRAWWPYNGLHHKAARARMLRRDGHPVRHPLLPTPTTVHIQKLAHRRTDYLLIPHGTTPDQYRKQQDQLAGILKHPVAIRPWKPGMITVTQYLQDLLAHPVTGWPPPGNDTPDRLWRGLNRDGNPHYSTLSDDGSGEAHLIGGVPKSGKSSLLNSDLAQLVAHRELVQLWIIDPAEGIDLGVWHRFAYRTAENPDDAIDLLEALLKEMEARRGRLVDAGFQKHPTSREWPLMVLVIDELPALILHEDSKQAARAVKAITRIRRIGRKTNTAILAATQDMAAEVIPRTMSKIFSHRICFRVASPIDARIALPRVNTDLYDPSAFDPAHHGRAIHFDGADFVEIRCPGLYGPNLRSTVQDLTNTCRCSDLPTTDTPSTSLELVPSPSPTTPGRNRDRGGRSSQTYRYGRFCTPKQRPPAIEVSTTPTSPSGTASIVPGLKPQASRCVSSGSLTAGGQTGGRHESATVVRPLLGCRWRSYGLPPGRVRGRRRRYRPATGLPVRVPPGRRDDVAVRRVRRDPCQSCLLRVVEDAGLPPGSKDDQPDLITPLRPKLIAAGVPYVIENVPGAPLLNPIQLCGSGLGLTLQRHRLFECSFPAWGVPCAHGQNKWNPDYGHATNRRRRRVPVIGEWRIPLSLQQEAMGIDWMTLEELTEAIPPAYTQFIGEQLLAHLEVAA